MTVAARRAAALAGLATAAWAIGWGPSASARPGRGRPPARPPSAADRPSATSAVAGPVMRRALADADAGEAAVVIRFDAPSVAALATALTRRVPGFARGPIDSARARLVRVVGADPTTPAGWSALGLDPGRPAIATFNAADVAGVLAAMHAPGPLLAGGTAPAARAGAGHPVWRARLVVPVADRARATATVRRWAGLVPGASLTPGPALARRHVIATARLGGAAGFARLDPSALILDVVVDGADPTAPPEALPRFLDDRRPFPAARLAAPAAALLPRPGVTVWIDPVRTGEALLIGAGPAILPLVQARCGLTCTDLVGPLGPLAIRLGVRGATITADVTWQVAAGSPLAAALAHTADHALPRPADVPDAALVAHSYVASWWPLASLDVTSVPSDLPPPTFAITDDLWPLTALYGWPYGIGGVLAHVAAAEPRARPVFVGLGDAALIVPGFGPDLAHTAAVAEIAADPGAAPPTRAFLDAVWGPARTAAGVTRWGAGPLRPFARTAGGAATFGLATGNATDAYLAATRRAGPPAPGTVAELRAAPATLARLYPLAGLLGTATATARFDGALRIDVSFASP